MQCTLGRLARRACCLSTRPASSTMAESLDGSKRRLLSTTPMPREVIAVLCPDGHPALNALPRSLAEFVVGSDLSSLDPNLLPLARGLVVVPFDPGCVASAGKLLSGGHAPKLRWVHCYTAGVDALSTFIAGPLRDAGLPLTNGRGAFSSSLAEYAMLAALHFNKKVARCQANRANKRWDKFEMPVLRGQTMGLLGYGDIAKHTAKLARAFGMRVIALRRNASKVDTDGLLDLVIGPYEGPIQPAHKEALLRESDVVVCTLPGTRETRHFMSTNEFNMMKAGATFISLGRGSAVDETALAIALGDGALGGAALDVFEQEPLPSASPLWDLSDDKILLTAHNADFTVDYFQLGWHVWAQNYESFMNSKPFATPVDTKLGY